MDGIETRSGRSYHQYCAVARALDYVGERWTLLLIRELVLGPKRFKDLLEGLPGIGTNLLANRLRDLEAAGVIRRRVLPPPAGSTVYELTELGQGLEQVVFVLGMWGRQFLNPMREDDVVDPAWFMVSLRATFHPEAAADLRESYHLNIDGKDFMVRVNRGTFTVRQEAVVDADVSVTTDLQTLIALLRCATSPDVALREERVKLQGDGDSFRRFVELFAWRPEQGAPTSPASVSSGKREPQL
jgi:DNA-binding HxlR family transcriptional regulator